MFWKINLDVPRGIRYIGNWSEFNLEKFKGHNILHKQLPGCGMTEYALTCPYPVVLCSPRKMLMENKKEQHGEDVYLVISKFDRQLDIDIDMSKPVADSIIQNQLQEETKQVTEEFKKQQEEDENNFYSTLFHEIQHYINSLSPGKYPKIIVTYDSAYLIRKFLEQTGLISNFWFIVDEFQSLLEDSRFKANTESNFLSIILQGIPNVLYVSATPMLDKYIDQIPQLNLPYYQLDWGKLDPTRIKKPDLKVRTMKSISSRMQEIVQSYLEGRFEKVVVERGGQLVEIESRECVIYVNSVNHIINIIKKLNLSPDQVNILCSDTPDNQRRIDKKLGKGRYQIGKVPLKGEPHKMFTFCTRTVYLGADFYSLCARSFIFSDANSESLSIDISMDLAQILGRQRLDENPWHNSAEFYYKATCDYRKMTWVDFKNIIDTKLKKSQNLCNVWEKGTEEEKNDLAEEYLYGALGKKYSDNYVGVNRLLDNTLKPTINNLVILNEERSFDIQQVDYKDRFSVFCSIEREFGLGIVDEITQFFNKYDQIIDSYIDKCKMICEFLIDNPSLKDAIINNLSDHDKIKQQLISIGPERMKGLGYNITRIKQAMGIVIFDINSLNETIYKEFLIGQRYTKKYIKEKLGEIYKKSDFNGTPKANDLENWFEIKDMKVTVSGKQQAGFEIIKRK